jgi:hypothetical protein
MRTETPQKVLEKLATSDKATIVVERLTGGKIRVTSGSWDGEKVILRDQVLEVRNVVRRLHIARKPRLYDEWDPPIERYGPSRACLAPARFGPLQSSGAMEPAPEWTLCLLWMFCQ